MSRKWVTLAVFFSCSMGMASVGQAGNPPPAPNMDANFLSEIKLSCEKYAKEDQIPPKEVKEYVARCVRDFSEAQPTDEFPPFESEEGIVGGAPPEAYVPLEKSQEMEKAYPIDPPATAQSTPSTTAKPSAPSAKPKPPAPSVTANPSALPAAKPPVPPVNNSTDQQKK